MDNTYYWRLLDNNTNEPEEQQKWLRKYSFYPLGHYYSPLINIEEVNFETLYAESENSSFRGINIDKKEQIKLTKELVSYFRESPFPEERSNQYRYFYRNDFYSYSDGLFLYAMMRHFKPSKIIEIGSGFSSALMLDVNDIFFNKSIELTFIEPNPEDRLYGLLNEKDLNNVNIYKSPVQETDISLFKELNKNDFLFIDSSHVMKAGSDLQKIFFEILPEIEKGVHIHFHDIFFPFQYPELWIKQGRSWNEIYMLRAFLINNNKYEISIFTNYLLQKHKDLLKDITEYSDDCGGSFWLKKI